MDSTHGTADLLNTLSDQIRQSYSENRSLLSFHEFFELFRENPRLHCRSVAQYVRDMLDHFGTETVQTPRGEVNRFKLFDMAFVGGRERLVGQELVQNNLYRVLNNFVRERRVTRLVLLHGPNGSAKSSLINCLIRGLEHYSHLDEGALYRFCWVFPTEKISRSVIGFDKETGATAKRRLGTYAHLDELEIDAKLIEELKDNPLFLMPRKPRQRLLLDTFGPESRDLERVDEADFILSDYIFEGDLSHKSRLIFDALLASYGGDYAAVLKHVQVERFYISRRYRHAAVTVEPQLRVDAGSRQVTADRSLTALPTVMQNQTLFEPFGDLVDGNRGIVEFNDLLKRHPDLNKYLLATVEKGTVAVEHAILYIDAFLIGSANEEFLDAFKGQPEYASFKGRLDLVRMPYLLDYRIEQQIYDDMLARTDVSKHVAPHTTHVASLWSVLTRLIRPQSSAYPAVIHDVVSRLTPLEKAVLYTERRVPEGLSGEQAREVRGAIAQLLEEGDHPLQYEGRYGMSPRETKNLLLSAVQRTEFHCLSPLAVFAELKELVKDPTVHPFLRIKPEGDYNDPAKFIDVVTERYLTLVDNEVRSSLGLVEQDSYDAYFARYVTTVSQHLKGEKVYNPVTRNYEDPNLELMAEVERALGVTGDARDFRHDIISAVAAYRIDNPDADIAYTAIFPELFIALEQSYFGQRKSTVERIERNLLKHFQGEGDNLSSAERKQVETTLQNMHARFGYCDHCAREAITFLLREHYAAASAAGG